MIYVVSTLVKIFTDPSMLICALLICGTVLLWSNYLRAARAFLSAASILALLFALLPLGSWALVPLEKRFLPAELPESIDGVIILGGAVSEGWSGRPTTNESADRVLAAIALKLRFPQAKFVYTSNNVSLEQELFRSLGVDPDTFIWEGKARNTRENATLSQQITKPKPGERWILVTSAAHMPRAVGAFRAVSWNVIPFAVDERTRGNYEYDVTVSASARLRDTANAMYEWLGLAEYWLLNWSSNFLPEVESPDNRAEADGLAHLTSELPHPFGS